VRETNLKERKVSGEGKRWGTIRNLLAVESMPMEPQSVRGETFMGGIMRPTKFKPTHCVVSMPEDWKMSSEVLG